MNKFTFLEKKYYFDKDRIDVIKKVGTKAAITDFSILLGGMVSAQTVSKNMPSKGKTGYYWSKTDDGCGNTLMIYSYGNIKYSLVNIRNGGARPALQFSSIDKIPTNRRKWCTKKS